MQLICFSYAGRGASVYSTWAKLLSPSVTIRAVQLPGRENRFSEPCIKRISDLMPELVKALQSRLTQPFALFGHSMGALICFELARELRRQNLPEPVHLFLSAHRAPHLPDPYPPIAHLSEEEFVEEVQRRYGGIPEPVKQSKELMEIMIPVLRADFEMLENYQYVMEEPLFCPITVLGGFEDFETTDAELEAWQLHSRKVFDLKLFPGDHFFLQTSQSELLGFLNKKLSTL
ncbi:MAG: alpha/beta fold hydrolase [Terriglobia bacterium]